MNQIQKDVPLIDQLEKFYEGRVVQWGMDDGRILFLDQNSENMTKGWVIGEINGDKFNTNVRRITKSEYGTIEMFWEGGAEAHDFEAYKHDEYAVEFTKEDFV